MAAPRHLPFIRAARHFFCKANVNQERELELLELSRIEAKRPDYPCGVEPNNWEGEGPPPMEDDAVSPDYVKDR